MAVMIPPECDLTKRPMSERIVFEGIRKHLSNQWYVFHSFDYVTRELNRERKRWDGEIDFLLYHPQKGILILEVKGGAVSYRNGQWYQEDRPMDPVEQARKNKYAVMALLREGLNQDIPLKFAHAVCFPSCGAQMVWPPEAQGIVLTGTTLAGIENFASGVLDAAPLPGKLAGYNVRPEEILRILSPVFEYGKKLSERIGIEEKQFFLFTEQQCAILNALEQFHRLQIKGCAGSGKTIMALKKAQRLASQGKRVLLLCYNQLLAQYLQQELKDYPSVTAAAFFEYCIQIMNIEEEQIAKHRRNPKLYSNVLPDVLRQFIDKVDLKYDAVIVDEGQDFSKSAWDQIARLPAEDGDFYIFYDPDQNIFNEELELPDFGLPPVVLDRNCRNTKKIFEAMAPYRTIPSGIMDDSPVGSDVIERKGNVRDLLAAELERLVMIEQIPLQDIVILTGHSIRNTSIGADAKVGRFRIVNRIAKIGAMEIACFTYMKFKGCEAKVVILLDVDESDSRWRKEGMYTAMSRAVHQLIILRKG